VRPAVGDTGLLDHALRAAVNLPGVGGGGGTRARTIRRTHDGESGELVYWVEEVAAADAAGGAGGAGEGEGRGEGEGEAAAAGGAVPTPPSPAAALAARVAALEAALAVQVEAAAGTFEALVREVGGLRADLAAAGGRTDALAQWAARASRGGGGG